MEEAVVYDFDILRGSRGVDNWATRKSKSLVTSLPSALVAVYEGDSRGG